jgi:hypothetical protein
MFDVGAPHPWFIVQNLLFITFLSLFQTQVHKKRSQLRLVSCLRTYTRDIGIHMEKESWRIKNAADYSVV